MKQRFLNLFVYLLVSLLYCQIGFSQKQDIIFYDSPEKYVLKGIKVITNSPKLDKRFVIKLSELKLNSVIQIPGRKIPRAIQTLWDNKVFSEISISIDKTEGNNLFLKIYVEERPRLSKFRFTGISNSQAKDLKDILDLFRGEVITKNLINRCEYRIKEYYAEKNYLNAAVDFQLENDTEFVANSKKLTMAIERGRKVRVAEMQIKGNVHIPTSKIRRAVKNAAIEKSRFDIFEDVWALIKGKEQFSEVDSFLLNKGFYLGTLEYIRNAVRINIFKSSMWIESEWELAKRKVINLFNNKGYRDAKIVHDSIYLKNNLIHVELTIEEGQRYYYSDIEWIGNKKYTEGQLDTLLGIFPGDPYNPELLQSKLQANPSGYSIASLYQDQGYLFFRVSPVEVAVIGDSILLEMRMYEGKKARIDKIFIVGNTKTNDRVILREIRTKPGELFSRSDIIRTQRALAQLGYFNPQEMNVIPIPHPETGTVDLKYIVAEAPSDQIQLSGGWGAGRIVGTLGLTLNNFSLRNMFKKGAWQPLPSGDGQRISINATSNGPRYQFYSFSFTEPWLGGNKPILFSIFATHNVFQFGLDSNSTRLLNTSAGITIGKRLKWPDDYFDISFTLAYSRYDARNYRLFSNTSDLFTGISHNISLTASISRNSLNDVIFPSEGSEFIFSVELTPPYSAFSDKNYATATLAERYKFLEYHKWKFKARWFTPLSRNNKFVMMTRVELGFIGYYNSQIGITPFERFFLGGDGLTGFNIDGREVIALRGYQNLALTPGYNGSASLAIGGSVYNKYTISFRYLISPNPQAKVFVLAFAEAGNAWLGFENYRPFQLNRSVGVGVRVFLPMFGLLGVDYGYGFDPVRGVPESSRQRGVFHFRIGQQF